MTKHVADAVTDAALRGLDPAPDARLTDVERERADATFARIVTSPASPGLPEAPDALHAPEAPRAPGRPHRSRSRWARVLVPVGLVGAAGATVPALVLGGSAFGSWTPTPEALDDAARAEAVAACRAGFDVGESADASEQSVIADRRGAWTYVLVTGPRIEMSCLMAADVVGGSGRTAGAGFMGGYTADPSPEPDLAPDGIRGYGMVGGMPVDGWWLFGDDEEWVNQVAGYVGSDVTAVTVHTRAGTDVEASVDGGRFAAWWPAPTPSSEHPDSDGVSTYTVTLVDGTRREVSG